MSLNKWTRILKATTDKLAKVSFDYSVLHNRCSIFYNYIDIILGLSSGLTTVITGILITIPSYSPCDRKGEHEQNVYTGLLFSSAILQFLKQYMGLGKESLKHYEYSKKYKILSNNLTNDMLIHKEDDKNLIETYIIDISSQINTNISTSPAINPLISWYYNKYNKFEIAYNDDFANNDCEEQFFSIIDSK